MNPDQNNTQSKTTWKEAFIFCVVIAAMWLVSVYKNEQDHRNKIALQKSSASLQQDSKKNIAKTR